MFSALVGMSRVAETDNGGKTLNTVGPLKWLVQTILTFRTFVSLSGFVCFFVEFPCWYLLFPSLLPSVPQHHTDRMAPEALLYQQYSPKTDVWAFGVVLYEIFTRQQPYPQLAPTQAAAQVIARAIKLTLPPGTNSAIAKLMDECMQYEPNDRPNFEEISQKLQSLAL